VQSRCADLWFLVTLLRFCWRATVALLLCGGAGPTGSRAAAQDARIESGTSSPRGAACTPQITNVSLPAGVVAVAYSQRLDTTGCPAPLTWSVVAGALPPGLVLNSQTGVISGTPIAVVNANFTVRVQDSSGASATSTFTLEVRFCVPEVTTPGVPAATVGLPYSTQLVIGGCALPFTWRISSGALPPGLTLNAGTGVISGVPTESITARFTATAQHLGTLEASRAYALVVVSCSLRFVTPSLMDGAIGQPYSDALSTSNCQPVTMSITVGSLPPGLQLDPDTGAITGTPSTAGSWTFTVTAVHAESGLRSSADYTIHIGAGCQITTSALPTGFVGQFYTQTVAVAGCRLPLAWKISGGALPSGLALNTGTGAISGTPAAAGKSTFSLTVEDSSGSRVTRTVTATIETAPSLPITPSSLQFTSAVGSAASMVQNLSIGSLGAGTGIATVRGTASWLRLSGASASVPGLVQVSADAAGLSEGTYRAQVQISSGPGTATIPVTLTVARRNATAALEPVRVLLTAVEGSSLPVSRTVAVKPVGAAAMWSASVDDPRLSSWLEVTLAEGQTDAALTVTATPTRLRRGTYRGAIRVQSSDQQLFATVILQVMPAVPVLSVDFDRVTFVLTGGGRTAQPQNVRVLNRGTGVLNWSARIVDITGGDWLAISPSSGISDAGDLAGSSMLTFSLRAAALPTAQGCRDARVQLSAGTDQVDTSVIVSLCITAAGADRLQLQPAASQAAAFLADTLLMTADASSPRVSRSLALASTSMSALPVAVAVRTANGGDWLSLSTSSSSASVSQPVQITYIANAAGLPSGIYRGTIAYQVTAQPVRSSDVSLIVVDKSGPCVPRRAVLVARGLDNNFQAPVRTVIPLSARVLDDCGNPIENAATQMTASGPDGSLTTISLEPSGNGFYTGQWQPVSEGAVDVTLSAMALGLAGDQKRVAGTNVPPIDASAPALSAVVNAASFVATPLAPGSIGTAFGSNLIARSTLNSGFTAPFIPLPLQLGGTEMWFGGHPAPLFFANLTQVNFQIPTTLPVDRPVQLVLRTGERFATLPSPVPIQGADPAVFNLQVNKVAASEASTCPASNPNEYLGPAAALNSEDSSFAQPSNLLPGTFSRPAVPGKAVSLFVNGLGDVTPPIASGRNSVEADGEPVLRKLIGVPRVFIGGREAEVLFAGLSPLLVGVYQVNVLVPLGTAGDRVPVHVEIAGVCSPAGLTIAVQ
jgi:uncharacterized protein (TIGR03437 family)